jgi:hypothetical protein
MKEQLIEFETAKLAKEKGFEDPNNLAYYNETGEYKVAPWGAIEEKEYSAPTQSLLQKWLRDVHNLHIAIYPITSHWEMDVRDCDMTKSVHSSPKLDIQNKHFETYEQALEAGLLGALKLIDGTKAFEEMCKGLEELLKSLKEKEDNETKI